MSPLLLFLFMILIALTGTYRNATDDAGRNILQLNHPALGMPVAQRIHDRQHYLTSSQQGIQNHSVELR